MKQRSKSIRMLHFLSVEWSLAFTMTKKLTDLQHKEGGVFVARDTGLAVRKFRIQPVHINKNASFVVNLKSLDDPSDVN